MMKIVRWLGMIAQDYKRSFTIFMIGQMIFFVGVALFYLSAKHYDQQPLFAEIVTLVAFIFIAIGIVAALIGYLSLTYGRWYHFFRKKPKTKALQESEEDSITPLKNKQATDVNHKDDSSGSHSSSLSD